jgi:hypothetical protein
MKDLDENILEDNFVKPEQFYQALNTLKEKMPMILEDFRNDFVNFNLNPENSEYESAFQNDKDALSKVNDDTVQLVKNIEKNTIKLNHVLFELNKLIQRAKKENKELKARLGIVNNEISATDELISNYKEMYNYGYLRNFGLLLCIIGAGVIISKTDPSSH